MKDLNKKLTELSQASKEWERDVQQSQKYISSNFSLKMRTELDGFDSFT